jgi:YHS domain-containing protein
MKRYPVCYMEVEEKEAVTRKCGGKIFYFCSEGWS